MDCPNVTYLELAMFQSSREREREHAQLTFVGALFKGYQQLATKIATRN